MNHGSTVMQIQDGAISRKGYGIIEIGVQDPAGKEVCAGLPRSSSCEIPVKHKGLKFLLRLK